MIGVHAAMRFVLLFLYLDRALGASPSDSIDDDLYGQGSRVHVEDGKAIKNYSEIIHRIESEMMRFNQSGDTARDRRALGILLHGFMKALGYTVSPLKLASLPNQSQAALMPVASSLMPPGKAVSSFKNNSSLLTPVKQQRETVRVTGILSLGSDANASSDLMSHLARYERIFHGNSSGSPTVASTASLARIDPISSSPLKEQPLFVKLPLPLVDQRSPSSYSDDHSSRYSSDRSEEYRNSSNETGQEGYRTEEKDKSRHREEHENRHEQYNGSEESNIDDIEEEEEQEEVEDARKKSEYKNSSERSQDERKDDKISVVECAAEEKNDPFSRSGSGPRGKFNHGAHGVDGMDEANQEYKYEDYANKIAAKSVARAEEEAERKAEQSVKNQELNGRNDSGEENLSSSGEKVTARGFKSRNDKSEDDKEIIAERSTKKSLNKKSSAGKSSVKSIYGGGAPFTQTDRGVYSDETEAGFTRLRDDYDELSSEENKEDKLPEDQVILPRYNNGESQEIELRDSYGRSLVKANGKIDERIAAYLGMFKNPRTGVYDPRLIEQRELSPSLSSKPVIPIDSLPLIINEDLDSTGNKYDRYTSHDKRGSNVNNVTRYNYPSNIQASIINNRPRNRLADRYAREPKRLASRYLRPTKSTATRYRAPPDNVEPIYSTIGQIHVPPNPEQAIHTKLESHTTPRLHERPNFSNYKRGQKTRPADAGRAPKIRSGRNLFDETEANDFTAWLAPSNFMRHLDPTEFNGQSLKETSTTIVEHTPVLQPPVLRQALGKPSAPPICLTDLQSSNEAPPSAQIHVQNRLNARSRGTVKSNIGLKPPRDYRDNRRARKLAQKALFI